MANPSNTLQATITATDANGNVPVNRGIGSPVFNPASSVMGDLTINQQLAAGNQTINMPVAQCYCLYVKNNAAPGGNTITVNISINGAGSVTAAVLQPGAVFIVWNTAAVVASSITALALNASGANTPVEYFIGG